MWLFAVLAGLIVLAAVSIWWLWTPDLDPAKLGQRYLRAPTDLVDLVDPGGVRLHLRDEGSKDPPAVIVLHGLGSSLHTWESWSRALAAEFRVVSVDLPGAGLSPPDPEGDYTDARTLQLLGLMMDHLGLARASFIGNSMGGRIAWTMAALHPERVDRLVLLSPDGFASPGFEYGKKPKVPAMLDLMRFMLPRAMLRSNLAPAYKNPAVLTAEMLDRYHDLLRAPGVRAAMLARMRQTVLVDPIPLLKKIEAPTLLLWGEADAMIPIANADDYLKAIPRVTLERLPGIGHLPQEEDPQRSVLPVRAFLASRA